MGVQRKEGKSIAERNALRDALSCVLMAVLIAAVLLLLCFCLAAVNANSENLQTSLKDFIADPGVQSVYRECSQNNWPIVSRLGTVKRPDPNSPQPVLYLFVKNNAIDIHLEYFRTPQGRYVVMIAFPGMVLDKPLFDFFLKK